MEIEVLPDYGIALKKVFNSILLVSEDKDVFGICMRDSGFEFQYGGTWYEAKNGKITEGAKNTEQANQPDSGE
jgi:hypothetical protein